MPRLAFLHTSPVHVPTFERLVAQADPSVHVQHTVAEDLLRDAQQLGADHPALVERVRQAVVQAAGGRCKVVVCTCSTIGAAAESVPAGSGVVLRIDRALGDEAVSRGSRVLVVAALRSTVGPTEALMRECARRAGREVQLELLVVEHAWSHFLSGDREGYLRAIAAAVRPAAHRADVVALAQASMADAAGFLQDLGVPVLSSPALGVARALALLRGAACPAATSGSA